MKRMAMMMFTALLGSALIFSALATAKPSNNKQAKKLANQMCQAEKRGANKAFKATYGKRAMRTCKKGAKDEIKDELKNAAKECKAERSDEDFALGHDGKSFQEYYGSNKNQKNAFGKCVSQKVKDEIADEIDGFKNAAKECKAERSDPAFAEGHEGKSFKEYYGSNKNQKNAFGKCVSQKVKEGEEPGGDV